MKSNLPDDIAATQEDLDKIINVHLVSLLREQKDAHNAYVSGFTIINNSMAMFFCNDMVRNSKELLVPIIEEYSKERAKEIIKAQADKPVGKKEKQHIECFIPGSGDDMVPLFNISVGVGKTYPELLDIQHQAEQNHGTLDRDWNGIGEDGPLVEFCRQALLSTDVHSLYTRSLKAEVDRLDSTRHGVSVSTHAEGAAKALNTGDSFESSFRTLCHLLQIFAKSLDTLEKKISAEGVIVMHMKRELLLGCGSCLARLITEYFLFKHSGEIGSRGDDHGLAFEIDGHETEDNALSSFQAVNVATLDFPHIVLKFKQDRDEIGSDPSNYLRSAFPGSLGIGLSKLWSLCSDGGKEAEGICRNTGDKLDLFIRHLAETCLTLVGLPFANLDKKAEKKVLAARREGVLRRLENCQESKETVMCTTVLVCQQVKNMPLAGKNTITTARGLLEQDKKIPHTVTECLQSLNNARDDPPFLIAQAKKIGLAKNSKALLSLC